MKKNRDDAGHGNSCPDSKCKEHFAWQWYIYTPRSVSVCCQANGNRPQDVAKGLALKTGVQFGFLVSAKVESNDYKDQCKKFNFSIPIGVSYEISDFVFDLRYNMGLNKTNKADNGNKARSDLFLVSLGYKFAL